MSDDIVVGIDGSTHASRALSWALDEAERRGCRVRAVLAWSYLGGPDSPLVAGTTEADAKALLDEIVDDVAKDRSNLVDRVAVNDLPAAGLLDQAKDASLVVVGSRGRGGLKGLLLGSVSRTVVERCPVPIAVIPPER